MYNDNAIILTLTLINVSISRGKRVINIALTEWSIMTFLIRCTFSLTNYSFVGHSQDIGIFFLATRKKTILKAKHTLHIKNIATHSLFFGVPIECNKK